MPCRVVHPSVQVVEHKSTVCELESLERELDAFLGLQLEHPNVVHTYKYTTRRKDEVSFPMPPASALLRTELETVDAFGIAL